MNFSLIINPSNQWRYTLNTALSLAETMTTAGHTINAVFFYGQAIKVINTQNALLQWQQWQLASGAKLLLCSTLIENNQQHDLAVQIQGFSVVAMGSWVQAMETSDRTVELT